MTKTAAHRHLRNCLRITRRAEKPRGESAADSARDSSRFDSGDPASLVATTARLVSEALDLLEDSKTAGDRRTALTALREARDGLALLMRIAGMLAGDGASTVIDNRRQVVQILGKLTEDELRALARGDAIGGVAALDEGNRDTVSGPKTLEGNALAGMSQ